jgi:hypothetical protein
MMTLHDNIDTVDDTSDLCYVAFAIRSSLDGVKFTADYMGSTGCDDGHGLMYHFKLRDKDQRTLKWVIAVSPENVVSFPYNSDFRQVEFLLSDPDLLVKLDRHIHQ